MRPDIKLPYRKTVVKDIKDTIFKDTIERLLVVPKVTRWNASYDAL